MMAYIICFVIWLCILCADIWTVHIPSIDPCTLKIDMRHTVCKHTITDITIKEWMNWNEYLYIICHNYESNYNLKMGIECVSRYVQSESLWIGIGMWAFIRFCGTGFECNCVIANGQCQIKQCLCVWVLRCPTNESVANAMDIAKNERHLYYKSRNISRDLIEEGFCISRRFVCWS